MYGRCAIVKQMLCECVGKENALRVHSQRSCFASALLKRLCEGNDKRNAVYVYVHVYVYVPVYACVYAREVCNCKENDL